MRELNKHEVSEVSGGGCDRVCIFNAAIGGLDCLIICKSDNPSDKSI